MQVTFLTKTGDIRQTSQLSYLILHQNNVTQQQLLPLAELPE